MLPSDLFLDDHQGELVNLHISPKINVIASLNHWVARLVQSSQMIETVLHFNTFKCFE